MGYYDKFLMHEDKRDKGMNSTTSAKGTDGKKNNSSEYNHAYYMKNKAKWEDNKESNKKSSRSNDDDRFYDKDGNARFGHKDYDENDEDFKRTDGEKIEGTNLRTFTNKNGSTIIMGDDIKFSFPPGTKITSAMARRIAKIESGDKSNKESYVAKMLNAVTGFADKQGLNTNTAGKKKSSSSKKSETKERTESKSEAKGKSKPSDKEKKDIKNVKLNLPSGFSIYETAEEDGETVFTIETPSGDLHEFVGVPSKEELEKFAGSSAKHSEEVEMNEEYLEHHGVKGMKWGVRRYQNYGGTYTQAGMKRYRDAEAKYDKADARYKDAKAKLKAARRNDDYQGVVSSKAEVTQAKLNRKMAKANLEKHYNHLKQDKLGDQGKKLYASGHTITGDQTVSSVLSAIGGMSIYAGGSIAQQRGGFDALSKALIGAGAASIGAAGVKEGVDAYRAKRLRAYYGHTSNY